MDQLHEFGMFLCTWALVMLVVAVAGKRIARWLQSMGMWPAAADARPSALQPARVLAVRTGKEMRG